MKSVQFGMLLLMIEILEAQPFDQSIHINKPTVNIMVEMKKVA